jgi:hypothetical protein
MKISKDQLKQIIKEEMAAMLNESPFPKLPSPSSEPKLINIKRVFNAQGDALDPSKGADITAQTVRLLAATQAGLPPEGTPIDVTLDMDGKVIGAQVAKRISPQSTLEEKSAYGDAIGQKAGHGRGPNVHQVDSEFISKETGGTGGFGDEIQDETTVVSDKDTFRSRQRSSRGAGKLDSSESDTSLVDNTGKRQSSTYRNKGDVSFDSFKQTPAGGSRAKASSKNPLGLGKAKGAFGGETLKKGGKQLNIGDEGYMKAFADVGMPGIPEAGEDDNLIADLNETFDRWKKLING